MKAVADDLDRMAQDVRKAINGAGDALMNADIDKAQAVIDGDIEIDALESSILDQCVRLLAAKTGGDRFESRRLHLASGFDFRAHG